MDLASVVAALASVGVRVSGSNPNNNIQGDSSRACPTGLAGPEPSGTHNDLGQHFHANAKVQIQIQDPQIYLEFLRFVHHSATVVRNPDVNCSDNLQIGALGTSNSNL